MKKADRCCIDCTYFDRDGKECHKFPPRLYVKTDNLSRQEAPYDVRVMEEASSGKPVSVALWPFVDKTDWCGAFEAEESVLKDGLNYLKSLGKKDK